MERFRGQLDMKELSLSKINVGNGDNLQQLGSGKSRSPQYGNRTSEEIFLSLQQRLINTALCIFLRIRNF